MKKAFGRGFKPAGRFVRDVVERFLIGSKEQRHTIIGKMHRIPERLKTIYKINKEMGQECGYAYFQDFIPGNKFDTRITVLGDHTALAFTRDVRKNDFRASGSGSINYDMNRIDTRCVEISFDIARKLRTQSIAFDFVIGIDDKPLITEISYHYVIKAVYNCPGYWDRNLQWHDGHIWPPDVVVDDIIKQLMGK